MHSLRLKAKVLACLSVVCTVFAVLPRVWADERNEAVLFYQTSSDPTTRAERYVSPTPLSPAVTNPPGFRWQASPDAVGYDLEAAGDPSFEDPVLRAHGLTLTVHTPAAPMPEGPWYWRYRARFADGLFGPWSEPHRFSIDAFLPEIPVPPAAEVVRYLEEAGRPRLYLTAGSLSDWRKRIDTTHRRLWEAKQADLESARGRVIEEPPLDASNMDVNHAVRPMADGMALLALSYLVTGERSDGELARAALLEIAAWDPDGSTSRFHSSYGFRSLMGGIARAYDWLAATDILTAADKRQVREAMIPRLEQFIAWYYADGELRWPYHSHANHALFMLAELAVAFAGDLPEAQDWLTFSLAMATANYPNWGRSDGSWSEGPYYWSISLNYHVSSLWALDKVLPVNLARHPFLANTGDYMLYLQAPWSRAPAYFGDTRIAETTVSQASVMQRLAALTGNPHYLWYAEQVPGTEPDFFAWDPQMKPRPPDGLPPARVFPDTGLSVMRTSLTDKERDIQFALNANPFGTVSHSWADQGSFTLDVFGESLVVGSGYYPRGWADRHHALWSWQSWAHNVPLVDGKGQAVRSADAVAQVERFFHSPQVDHVRVDATRAYQARSAEADRIDGHTEGISARAGELPVESYRRSVIFLRPGVFVLFDDLEAARDVSFDWLLHSTVEMDLRHEENAVILRGGEANLRVDLLADADVKLRQSNEYRIPYTDIKVPPTPAWHPTPEQWRLKASLQEKRSHHRLVSVLSPYRTGDPLPAVHAASGSSWSGAKLRWPDASAFAAFAHAQGLDAAAIKHRLGVGGIEARARTMAVHSGAEETWLYAAELTDLLIEDPVAETETTRPLPTGRWTATHPVDVLVVANAQGVSWYVVGAEKARWRGSDGTVRELHPGVPLCFEHDTEGS